MPFVYDKIFGFLRVYDTQKYERLHYTSSYESKRGVYYTQHFMVIYTFGFTNF